MKRGKQLRPKRLTIRLPERLHEALVPLAEADNRYLADWIVVTLEHAMGRYSGERPLTKPRHLGEMDTEGHRITLRVTANLHQVLKTVATNEKASMSHLVRAILDKVR